jgi:hypothetical protein
MKILRVLPLFLLLTAPLFAASITGIWKGDVKIPAGAVVPFSARLKQQGDKVTGTLSVGPAKDIPIFNGETVGDTITFSAIHKVAVVSATETKKLDKPVQFDYTATLSGDRMHIAILHHDGQGAPNEVDTVRSVRSI